MRFLNSFWQWLKPGASLLVACDKQRHFLEQRVGSDLRTAKTMMSYGKQNLDNTILPTYCFNYIPDGVPLLGWLKLLYNVI